MVQAKVILKGAKTYTLNGRRFIQDVTVLISGEKVKEFQANGHFSVTMLKAKAQADESEAKAKVKASASKSHDDDEDEDEEEVAAPKKKSILKK